MRSRSSRSSGASRGSLQWVIMLSNEASGWDDDRQPPSAPRRRTLGPARWAKALARPSVSPVQTLSTLISGSSMNCEGVCDRSGGGRPRSIA